MKELTAYEKFQTGILRNRIGRIVIYVCLILWSLTTIFPLVWVLLNSFKHSGDVITHSFSIAVNPTFDNYINAFDSLNIGRSYINSLIMSGGTVFFVLLFGGMSAFILARFNFKLRSIIQTLLVASLLIPSFATVVPVFEILNSMHLLNTYLALILPHTAGFLPFAVLVISGYMASIPKELEEAARIDGCNLWQMFRRIFVPISMPSFATCSVFVFLWSYNDLFSSLIFVNHDGVRPIVALLSMVSSQYGTDYGLMAASIALTVFPVLVVYLFIQRTIQRGLTAGAVKG